MADKVIKTLRDFPSVEELVQSSGLQKLSGAISRALLTDIARKIILEEKKKLKKSNGKLTSAKLITAIENKVKQHSVNELQPVINASGILVHTNLGRAPLGKKLTQEIVDSISGYCNLEFDIASGKRGIRAETAETYLAKLTGAESAAIVNNCAAALFIIINTFSLRKNVLLSRGELVQIGGGFRIPEILKRSGAKLNEVGTTNITKAKDYSDAADLSTSMILKVHKSNFVQSGFTEETPLEKLVPIAKKKNLLLVEDLGSGAIIQTSKLLGYNEPTPRDSLKTGADLVCFSGDKMFGGVQAGLIVGKKTLIEKIKENPLFRAIRVDKITIAALEKTLKSYLNSSHTEDIKLLNLLSISESELYKRAKNILKLLGEPDGLSVEATESYIGGGGLPELPLSSVGIVFSTKFNANKLFDSFRALTPHIIGRIEKNRFTLDLKAVDKDEYQKLTDSIKSVLNQIKK